MIQADTPMLEALLHSREFKAILISEMSAVGIHDSTTQIGKVPTGHHLYVFYSESPHGSPTVSRIGDYRISLTHELVGDILNTLREHEDALPLILAKEPFGEETLTYGLLTTSQLMERMASRVIARMLLCYGYDGLVSRYGGEVRL